MSQDEKYDSKGHVVKFLGPEGHLHLASGFITKEEQFVLMMGDAVFRQLKKLQEIGEKTRPNDVTDAIINSSVEMSGAFVTLSGSVDGKRSRQLTAGLKAEGGAPPEMPQQENWLRRNFGRKKDDVTSEK